MKSIKVVVGIVLILAIILTMFLVGMFRRLPKEFVMIYGENLDGYKITDERFDPPTIKKRIDY